MISVAIVDCHASSLNKLEGLLEGINDVSVQIKETRGLDFIKAFVALKQPTAIAIIDYPLTDIDSISMISFFNFYFPETKVVCVTEYDDGGTVAEVFGAGVFGFISKGALGLQTLHETIYAVLNGQISVIGISTKEFSPAIAAENREKGKKNFEKMILTRREKVFVMLNATTLTYREMAKIMYIDERTVETRAYRLYRKLNIVGGEAGIIKQVT